MKTLDMMIAAALGVFVGIFSMAMLMENGNRDFTVLQGHFDKAQEICESFNSTPEGIDFDDELICANGAVVNYKTFGEDK